MSPFLSQTEIDEACHPLTQPAAQVRYLAGLGIPVKRKPGGQALVLREHLATVLGNRPTTTPTTRPQPDAAGIIDLFTRRRVMKGIA